MNKLKKLVGVVKRVRAFARAHGARILAVWAALAAYLVDTGLDVPKATSVVVAVLSLLAGEAVQRVENKKTAEGPSKE